LTKLSITHTLQELVSMKSGIVRSLLLCAPVILASSAITINTSAQASTWVPISSSQHVIFIPKAGFADTNGVQVDSFVYGNTAAVTLNDFGSTSAVYYQTQQWSNGSFAAPGAWQCNNKTQLTANNDSLQIGLSSGRYKVTAVAVMAQDTCDLVAFAAGNLIASDPYTSNEFMVINQTELTDSNASLAQDRALMSVGGTADDFNSPKNTPSSYDLWLNWLQIDGADSYQLTLLKDSISYDSFNNITNPISVADYQTALANDGHFTIADEFFPAAIVSEGTFTPYTGPGSYRFAVRYCFNQSCSTEIGYSQSKSSLAVRPLQAEFFFTDGPMVSMGLEPNQVRLDFKADKRTNHFVVSEQMCHESAGSYQNRLCSERSDFNFTALSAPLSATGALLTDYRDDGRTLFYRHILQRDLPGHFRYTLDGCAQSCELLKNLNSITVFLSQNSTGPFGQLDTYQPGVQGNVHIKGWASDLDAQAINRPISVRLMINGYASAIQSAHLVHSQAGNSYGFDFDLEAMIDGINLLQGNVLDTRQSMNIELSAQDYGTSNYVRIGTMMITKAYKDKPVAMNDAKTLAEGMGGYINVIANDIDNDAPTYLLTPIITSWASYGSLAIQSDKTIHYTPNSGSTATSDTFQYRLEDALGQQSDNIAVVSLTFADFAANDDVLFTEALAVDQSVTLDVTSNDDNPSNGIISVGSGTVSTSYGQVSVVNNQVVYTLKDVAGNENTDTFSYSLSKGGVSSTALASLGFWSPQNDSFGVEANATTVLDVLSNDVLGSATAAYPEPMVLPTHGTARKVLGTNGWAIEYTPTPNTGYVGPDSFTYRLATSDFFHSTATATVTIDVSETPDMLSSVSVVSSSNNYTVSWPSNGSDAYKLKKLYSRTPLDVNNPGSAQWQSLNKPAADTQYSESNATWGYYYFRASACTSSGLCSDWRTSAGLDLVTDVTSGLAVTPGSAYNSLDVQWDFNGSVSYVLQKMVNPVSIHTSGIPESAWQAVSGKPAGDNYDSLTELTAGYYHFRVKSCDTSGNSCGSWQTSGEHQIMAVPPKRIIFMHSDLLGSPVAESDENGDLH
jgi:hypothetical protein